MSHDDPRVENERADLEAALVAAMIKQARSEDGRLQCSTCGQEIAEGEGNYSISLMGRGVFCKNGECGGVVQS